MGKRKQRCPTYLRSIWPNSRSTRSIRHSCLLASHGSWFWTLRWRAKGFLLTTRASKHQTGSMAQWRKEQPPLHAANGTTSGCLARTVSREGKKPRVTSVGGRAQASLINHNLISERSERHVLGKRLLAETCEMCGSGERRHVPHIRKLADLEKGGRERPRWVTLMAARQRKTLVFCHLCQQAIHTGHPPRRRTSE